MSNGAVSTSADNSFSASTLSFEDVVFTEDEEEEPDDHQNSASAVEDGHPLAALATAADAATSTAVIAGDDYLADDFPKEKFDWEKDEAELALEGLVRCGTCGNVWDVRTITL